MARTVYLVRHAEVAIDRAVLAHEWQLSASGRAQAASLGAAPCWARLVGIASSPEPKALGTAAPIAGRAGLPVEVDQDLREVARGSTWVVGAERYVAQVSRYLAAPAQPPAGWEPAPAAQARAVGCLERLAADARGPVCVVSHGLVLSLLVAALLGRPAPGVREWRSIPLPAVAVLDLDDLPASSAFLTVETFLASPAAG